MSEKTSDTPEIEEIPEETEELIEEMPEKTDESGEESTGETPDPVTELTDKLMRLAAEYDNYRKRAERERKEIYTTAKADCISGLLPILDNLARAALNGEAEYADYKKGIEMVAGQLTEALSKMGVGTFGEAGEEFDPVIHDAVLHIEDETLGENVIAEVFQQGYKLGDKILRHAMVKVAN